MKAIFDEKELTFESQKTEFSDGSVSISCGYTEELLTIGLNVRFTSSVAKVFKKEEFVTISLTDQEKPICFQSSDCEQFKAVLMPVIIKW